VFGSDGKEKTDCRRVVDEINMGTDFAERMSNPLPSRPPFPQKLPDTQATHVSQGAFVVVVIVVVWYVAKSKREGGREGGREGRQALY